MRVAKFALSFLLVGISNGYPQYLSFPGEKGKDVAGPANVTSTGCPLYTHECVPHYQCIDGQINHEGSVLTEILITEEKECKHQKYPDVPGVCCTKRGSTPNPTVPIIPPCENGHLCVERGKCPTNPPALFDITFIRTCYDDTGSPVISECCPPAFPTPLDGCGNRQLCLPEEQCISGTGAVGVGAEYYNSCYIDKANHKTGLCCHPPIREIDECPSDSVCASETHCRGEILNSDNFYVLFNTGGYWSQCPKGGDIQNPGVCCRNPKTKEPQYKPASNCGIQNNDRKLRSQIQVFENETQFGEFPWQAILFFKNSTYKCGASLVADRWLITGAHCVNGYQFADFKVRLGEWRVDTTDEPLSHVDVDIVSIIVHPDFHPVRLINNIAVIELTTPVDLKYHINTVCLPTPGEDLLPGTSCFASGWPKEDFEGAYQAILRKIDLPFVDHTRCQTLFSKTRLGVFFKLDASFMCAGGEEGQDGCIANKGGPLVCKNPATGAYTLRGITSWRISCGQQNVPYVFTDVQFFADWISNIIHRNPVAEVTQSSSPPYGRR